MFALQFHDGGRFTAIGTLRMLIRTAYRLQDSQAGWRIRLDERRPLRHRRAGRAADAMPDEMRVMLRALLTRALRSHPAARAAGGAGVRGDRATSVSASSAPEDGRHAQGGRRAPHDRPRRTALPRRAAFVAPGILSARGVTMAMLASELSMWVDRIVSDRPACGGSSTWISNGRHTRYRRLRRFTRHRIAPVAPRRDPNAPVDLHRRAGAAWIEPRSGTRDRRRARRRSRRAASRKLIVSAGLKPRPTPYLPPTCPTRPCARCQRS